MMRWHAGTDGTAVHGAVPTECPMLAFRAKARETAESFPHFLAAKSSTAGYRKFDHCSPMWRMPRFVSTFVGSSLSKQGLGIRGLSTKAALLDQNSHWRYASGIRTVKVCKSLFCQPKVPGTTMEKSLILFLPWLLAHGHLLWQPASTPRRIPETC